MPSKAELWPSHQLEVMVLAAAPEDLVASFHAEAPALLQKLDAAMQITEVVRGADLLKSTARQLLLIRTLGYPVPAYFHCPLLRDEKNVRLAKRHDACSLRKLREQGVKAEELRERFAGEVEWEKGIP